LTLQLRSSEAAAYPTCSLNMIATKRSGHSTRALESIDTSWINRGLRHGLRGPSTREIASLFGAVSVGFVALEKTISAPPVTAPFPQAAVRRFFLNGRRRCLDENSKAYLVKSLRSPDQSRPPCCVACDRTIAHGRIHAGQAFPEAMPTLRRRVHEQIMFSLRREGICLVQCPG